MIKNYTIQEAADKLRIPEGTLRKHQHEIGYSKLGRLVIFREEDLEQWMQLRRRKPIRELVEGRA
ncbi:MAG: helix-turn-helix domain-containing protein [Mangrovibacterium sp.]|jgi:excisionase family DNA binding protein